MMEFLSLLPLLISIISFIYKKITENDDFYSSASFQSYGVAQREQLTNDEFYNSLQLEDLVQCYATNKVANFNFNSVLERLHNGNANFEVLNIIRKKNVLYIKVAYGLPYNAMIKDFVASFSMNYIQPNHNVIIYGTSAVSLNQKDAFEQIAHSLIQQIVR